MEGEVLDRARQKGKKAKLDYWEVVQVEREGGCVLGYMGSFVNCSRVSESGSDEGRGSRVLYSP